MRRLIVHESVADEVVDKVATAYRSLRVGDPFAPGTLVGPLHSPVAFARMQEALEQTGWVQTRAAELIGMPLRTFQQKVKQYGLQRGRSAPQESA